MRACDRPACNTSSLHSRSQEIQCTDCRHASGIVTVDQRIRMFTGSPAQAGTTAQGQQTDCGAICACWESIPYPMSSLQGNMFKHYTDSTVHALRTVACTSGTVHDRCASV